MAKTTLRLARNLRLPLDLAVEATAVVGKRGRGKTFTAKRLVEEVLRAGVTVLVIDPTDVWWGLRSGADGQENGGLDVVTVGGTHDPDLPVREGSGKMLARLVLDGTSIVLSPKGLVKSARRRLVGELLAELYDRANGTPILVVVDEADEYAPEGARSYGGNKRDDPLVLASGAVEDIVRRGRAGGLGSLLITQRVAVLSKNVLEQSDTLIALGVTGKNDIEAVASWIAKHAADIEAGKRITASLPGLPRGTAWVWSPEYDVLERVEVLPITTFDSSRSPKVGEVAVTPKSRKAIDLAALGEEMERFAAEVKADDPKELRRRVAELERDLAAERNKPAPEPVEIRVEVPVLAPEIVDQLEALLAPAASLLGEAQETMLKHRMWAEEQLYGETAAQAQRRQSPPVPTRRPRTTPPPAPPAKKQQPPAVSGQSLPEHIPGAQQKLLDSLAWFASAGINPVDRTQLALFAGVSPKSSGYANNLGALRTAGLIDYPAGGVIALTGDGHQVAAPAEHISSTEEMQAALLSRLPGAQRRILEPLILEYPDAVEREVLAGRAGVSSASSGYANNLGALRSLGLIDYPQRGWVAVTSVLFLEGR